MNKLLIAILVYLAEMQIIYLKGHLIQQHHYIPISMVKFDLTCQIVQCTFDTPSFLKILKTQTHPTPLPVSASSLDQGV